MFVLNTNQSPHSVADKLWLTVIPFLHNTISIPAGTFEENEIKKLGNKKIQGVFFPKLFPIKYNTQDVLMGLRFSSTWENQFRFLFDLPIKGKLRGVFLPIQFSNFTRSYMVSAKIKLFKINAQGEMFYTKEKDFFQFIDKTWGNTAIFLSIFEDEELVINKDNEFFGFEILTNSQSGSSTSLFFKRNSYKYSSTDLEYYPCLIIE